MIRVQAQLTQQQLVALRRISRQRGVSVAALLREGAERVIEDAAGAGDEVWERAWRSIHAARGSGRSDVSTEHDRHLDDAFGS